MSNKKTTELSKLQDVWYEKLKKDGFKDIEQRDGNLKQWESHAFGGRYNHNLFNSKSKYYQLAGQYLHENEFETEKSKKIWELHSEGFSITQISAQLKKKRRKSCSRSSVQAVVKKLATEMLKKYGSSEDE